MGMGPFQCYLGFSSAYSNPLTERLERHAAVIEASYRNSNLQLLLALSTLHDAVDSALADDEPQAAEHLQRGMAQLHASNEQLTLLGEGLVRVRADLFERRGLDHTEPLLAREPYFASLDYDGLYRELAGQGAALPGRTFWDEVASRLRDGGARGGLRLLERHARELQGDLRSFIAEVEAIGRLTGRAQGEALHDTGLSIARVLTGFTRLFTSAGYVSYLCGRAMGQHERAVRSESAFALVAS